MGKHRRALADWIRRREQLWQLAQRLSLACLAAMLLAMTTIDRGTATYVLSVLLIAELIVIILVTGGLIAFCRTERG